MNSTPTQPNSCHWLNLWLRLTSRNFWTLLPLFLWGLIFPASAEVLVDHRTGRPVRYAGKFSNKRVNLPAARENRHQFRGVWVALVHNIDFPKCNSARNFQRNFTNLVNQVKRFNFNVLIFQVRVGSDAVYNSKLNPMSAFLTGREGSNYGHFNPLPYMVKQAHRRGLEFHAWLNPYRVVGSTKLTKNAYLKTLHPSNFAVQHPEFVLEFRRNGQSALFFNPGEPEVRRHIIETVREILQQAPVDAIHFDDYFYPKDVPFVDAHTYRMYNPRRLKLADWRRENVNTLIKEVSRLVRSYDKEFGVSPCGIWANAKDVKGGSPTAGMQSYSHLFADVRYWIRANYIDYVIPQLYWGFAHEVAAYAGLTDWWCQQVKGRKTKLYIGQGLYRIGTGEMTSDRELYNQLRYNSKRREIKGFAFFSWRRMLKSDNNIQKRAIERARRSFMRYPAQVR